MAEYFTLYCEKLDIRTVEEYEWLKAVYALTPSQDWENDENLDTYGEIDRVQEELGLELQIEDFDDHCNRPYPQHEYELKPDSLSVWSEADIGTDMVSRIIQTFLRRFRPEESFSINWAFTCSKMWASEFSGGFVFITADEIKWYSARNTLMEMEKAHKEKFAIKKGGAK